MSTANAPARSPLIAVILSLAAIGLNILMGYCGQVSLGSGAFMAIGAYAAYNLSIRLPFLNPFICILLGGFVAAAVGILFGIPSLRIKGFYLACATLAAQFFADWAFLRVKWFTNYTSSGSVTAPSLDFFGFTANTPIERYLLCLIFVTAFALIAKNLKTNDPEGLERAYRAYNAAFPEVPYPNAEGVKTLLDDMAPRTPKAATADPKSFVDMSVVQELEASGLIKQLYKR